MKDRRMTGHLAALLTVLIWGTTYISTKVLLQAFQPIEVLFFRFFIGFIALLLADPHPLRLTDKGQEGLFALAGLCGVCLYSLLQNIALGYTLASNVGVIISAAPFFTAILSFLLLKEERLRGNFFVGFAAAMAGICLINFNGSAMDLNPLGDLLVILAAIVWGFYSVITKRLSGYGYRTTQMTRRIFGYGLLFIIPALFLFDFRLGWERFMVPTNLFNILFLGLGASALCFVTWNYAIKILGTVKSSVYIYLEPVITIVTSVLVLSERITPLAILGTALTLAGLMISESNFGKRKPTE